MNGDLEGKIAIVTGGLRGIGRAISTAFAQEGAHLAVFDLDTEDQPLVRKLQEEIATLHRSCLYAKVDITQVQEVHQAVDKAIKTFGRIDILVNNAGHGMDPIPLEDLEEEDWDCMIDLNLKGTYICTRAVIRHMQEQRSGRIINISSQAARSKSEIANLPYASAKAGILGFTRNLAFELGPYGINVNAIAPGVVISGERIAKRMAGRPKKIVQQMLEQIPLRRFGKPKDISGAAVFLASDKSSYITGATIDVNGGRTMM